MRMRTKDILGKVKLILTAFPVFLAVILSGCGGGGGGSTPASVATISGVVVKGPVSGATVTFFSLNVDGSKATQLGTTTTDASGNYTITLTPAPATPLLAETSGGTYVDEVTNATVMLSATDKLSVALPVGAARAAITPLTDIAAARAQSLAAGGIPLATAIESSNIGVASQYGIADIVTILPPAANNESSAATATRDEKNYALVLAGIAQQANVMGVRVIDLAKALAEDAKDGILDGKNGVTAINIPTINGGSLTLPSTAGTADIQTAINAFISSINNKTNITQVRISSTPVNIGVNTASMPYPSMSVLPAAVSGNAYTAILTAKGGTPPYTCALKAESTMPQGFSLAPSTCQITGTATIATYLRGAVFPSITLTDSAMPANSVDFAPLYLTIDPPPGAWAGTYSGTATVSGCPGTNPVDRPVNGGFNIIIQNGVITGDWIIVGMSPSEPVVIGAVAGNVITFERSWVGPPHLSYSFTGTINGSQANGTWLTAIGFGGCVSTGSGTWSAHSVLQ